MAKLNKTYVFSGGIIVRLLPASATTSVKSSYFFVARLLSTLDHCFCCSSTQWWNGDWCWLKSFNASPFRTVVFNSNRSVSLLGAFIHIVRFSRCRRVAPCSPDHWQRPYQVRAVVYNSSIYLSLPPLSYGKDIINLVCTRKCNRVSIDCDDCYYFYCYKWILGIPTQNSLTKQPTLNIWRAYDWGTRIEDFFQPPIRIERLKTRYHKKQLGNTIISIANSVRGFLFSDDWSPSTVFVLVQE